MIRVNGKQETFEGTISLNAYVEKKGYRPERIAVERNGEIVPRNRYGETLLADGDVLEIVSFVGGG